MLLCEAAGYRNVLVETVGVGQSETAVRSMVDFFLLLMLAGAGDELQGMKRGIVEMTDLIAFNKADGDNRAKAEAARREYENALHLFSASGAGWTPRVITCSARAREGIAGIWDVVLEHHAWLTSTGKFAGFRQQQVKSWMYESIDQALRDEFLQHTGVREKLASYEQEVLAGRLSPFRAARRLIRVYTENPS
jgi:LAO/AO transport system kinase